jgi:hypothetical protein
MKFIFISLLSFCFINNIYGQIDSIQEHDKLNEPIPDSSHNNSKLPEPIKSYTTALLQGEAPHIDGYLNDPAWEQVAWGGGDFRQITPDKGKPASVQTKFKILYDAKNIYFAIKSYDPEPDKIMSRMSRRDGFEGDLVEINIDSYYDKRTAFSFTPSVSGVKGDEYVSNNGDNWDASWDPIWYMKTSIDAEGWVAEVRIPLSQLRFADKPEHTWGIQIMRSFYRNQERSVWQYIPPDAPGWVHLFADLKGIKGIRPQKQLEIQPYVVTKTETFQKEEGNPYMTGSSSSAYVGLDAKIGITSDITLDLTVNPDFGQVEADPSRVNLSAFELYFQERRPFFIEGNNTLNFPINGWDSNNLFYSRRVGRPPQAWADTDPNGDDGVPEYVKMRNRTRILGAAKLTGKNTKGFSWGLMESVTQLEHATIDSLGFLRKQQIEPMTNYFVARAQQDINKGNTIVGGMFTAVNRKIEAQNLNWLHDNAYSGGLDFVHNWKARTYYVSAKALMSYVNGSAEAILNTQLSSRRYFQRPDNNHANVNPDRRSLAGTGGIVSVGKKSGKIISDLGFTWTSPGLELNDIGYLAQTDLMTQWVWMQYRVQQPKGILRSQSYDIVQSAQWDFDRRKLGDWYECNIHLQFKNFWQFGSGLTYSTNNVSNADLRGGPALRYPASYSYWMNANTDRRKKFYISVNPSLRRSLNNYYRDMNLNFELVYRPVNALSISLAPGFSGSNNQMQYVTTGDFNSEPRYIVSEIKQTTINLAMRLTYMMTPNLSLQYWGQPFGTAGKYSNFKNVTNSNASSYTQRFAYVPSNSLSFNNNQYQVDENQDGIVDYSFDKPDFNFGQFRSNMVIRWEYIPGSTVFLVWTRERNGAFYDSQNGQQKYSFDFSEKGHNIFLIKFTYRFVL